MPEALSKYERETVVSFNDDSQTAQVYTCNRKLQRQLRNKGYTVIRDDDFSTTFECPKRCISFRNPVVKPRKPMSEEQKERMRKAREAQTVL